MRIEAYNQVAQLYHTGKAAKAQNTKDAAGARDEVQISSFGHDYQIAKQAVAEAADVREDKIAQLKASINADNYEVSTSDFAAKLLEKYNAFTM